MGESQINNSKLHHIIIKHVMEKGYAPDLGALMELLQADRDSVIWGLKQLEADHGVVLHPDSFDIWVIHPFSLSPTNFWVQCDTGSWWGNCAWCSLGIATLLKRDVTITTSMGAYGDRIDVHIQNGHLIEDHLLVHFPIPMQNAWENVIYTCSTMLVFESDEQIDAWSEKHRITKGDVQPISNIWQFAKVWYGNHLSPDWKKWTNDQAREIFDRFGLTGPIWEIPISNTRF